MQRVFSSYSSPYHFYHVDRGEAGAKMVLDALRRGGRTEEEEAGGRGLTLLTSDCSRSGRQLWEVSGLQEMFSLAWERRCPLFSLSLARKPEGGSGSRRATSGGSDTPNCRRQRDTFPWLAQYLLCLLQFMDH